MKISLNWIKEFTDVAVSIDELIALATERLGGVEGYENIADKYENIVVASVVSCEKHPDADKLSLCFIDDGGVVENVERSEDGNIQVVCGAPNVAAGQTVAWIPPGATVPSTHGTAEPFKLEARKLRGKVSNGMIASPKELDLSDDHEGILVLEKGQPGESLAEIMDLDDTVVEIENKMFTHRPDGFGQLGVAREIAGIQHQQFRSPDWYWRTDFPSGEGEAPLEVSVETENCPRYSVVVIDGIKVGPSPDWVRTHLQQVGIRPINNVVDITNYIMMLTAQPLHAFDFDKITQDGKAHIVVREPREGDSLELLDGKTIEPKEQDVLIATEKQPIGLGGIMGGANSEVSENTTKVVLECANFDMYNIRRSSMRHGLFTDAVTRFNKGQSPQQIPPVMAKAIEIFREIVGGSQVGPVVDVDHSSHEERKIEVAKDFINERLGSDLSVEQLAETLQRVEIPVQIEEETMHITSPFWRTDLEIPEDIVEEVGRLHGFNTLPSSLPKRSISPARSSSLVRIKGDARSILSAAGANEVTTYSFVHGDLLEMAGQSPKNSYKITNAISPELHYYRQSLTPSLLENVHANIKAGFGEFALFEIGKVHHKQHADTEEPGLPKEWHSLSMVYAAENKVAKTKQGAAFYQARAILDELAQRLGVELEYSAIEQEHLSPIQEARVQPFNTDRTALVKIKGSEIIVGFVGEFTPTLKRKLKLPVYVAGFDLDLELIADHVNTTSYLALSRFPAVEQDISLRVKSNINFKELEATLLAALDANMLENSDFSFTPIDIYQPEADDSIKQYAFRLSVASHDRTLKAGEVNQLLDEVAAAASKELNAQRL